MIFRLYNIIPCLISALLIPTLPIPLTGPEDVVTTALLWGTTACEVGAGGYVNNIKCF